MLTKDIGKNLQGTAEDFITENPILGSGQAGIETDTNKYKIGDGIALWNDLEYVKVTPVNT